MFLNNYKEDVKHINKENNIIIFKNLGRTDLSTTWICRDRSGSLMADYNKSNQGYIKR